MGFFEDLGEGLKDLGKGTAKVAKKTTDVLVDKDAWKNTTLALADGPGGREVKKADLLSMALDSSMLIPGAGLAGGAARIGARQALKAGSKEAAEQVAKRKAVVSSLRSPLNNQVRGATGDLAQLLGAKGGAVLTKTTGKATGKRVAQKAKDPLDTQLGRMAAKKQAGVGTKVGFGQSKKRILRNAALTGGANLLVRGYDNMTDGDEEGTEGGNPFGPGGAFGPGGPAAGVGGAGAMYLVGADGSAQEVPKGFMDALAAFMAQNGTVDGSQVIYNK